MAKRHQHVEHAILSLVLRYGDRDGYPNTLPGLASILRQTFPDIDNGEIVDTLKRLSPKYLTLRKYSDAHRRFVVFPDEIADDEQFFYRADFRLRRTPETDPYVQSLALEVNPPEAQVSAPSSIDEVGRRARFERWEQMGIDRVKGDLIQTGGRREVGGSLEVRNLAWQWVRMKEAGTAGAVMPNAQTEVLSLIAETRLEELRRLSSSQFDLKKLVQLCEEVNVAYGESCYFATAMLIRGVLDHVPPLFGCKTFGEVASNYGNGGRSFKDAMWHLENAARKVADAHLHVPIREKETLPTAQQVNCGQQLDVLLAEIVRITR